MVFAPPFLKIPMGQGTPGYRWPGANEMILALVSKGMIEICWMLLASLSHQLQRRNAKNHEVQFPHQTSKQLGIQKSSGLQHTSTRTIVTLHHSKFKKTGTETAERVYSFGPVEKTVVTDAMAGMHAVALGSGIEPQWLLGSKFLSMSYKNYLKIYSIISDQTSLWLVGHCCSEFKL